MSISSKIRSFWVANSTNPYPSFLSLRMTSYFRLNISALHTVSQVSVPMMMLGSAYSIKFITSSVSFLMLWKFLTMVFNGYLLVFFDFGGCDGDEQDVGGPGGYIDVSLMLLLSKPKNCYSFP